MAKLYDTHCHLDLQESRIHTLNEIEKHQIYTIAVTNLPPLYVKMKSDINSKYVMTALGFHPELISQYQKYIPEMWQLLPDATYIGEVGIDLKVGKESKRVQIDFFEELIDRCNALGDKIVTVHSRAAVDEVTTIIGNDFKGKIILHWFSGSKKYLHLAIENGYYFSVNFSMLSSKSGINTIMEIPENRLLIETDSPFVSDGNKYSAALIKKTIAGIADIKESTYDQINEALWNNFMKLIS